MKFLVGFNGSDEAKAALTLATEHALIFSGVKVLVVASGGSHEKSKDIDKAVDDLLFAEQYLAEKGVDHECHQLARGMNPGEDLVRFAADNGVDQIFVGIEKKSRAQKIILRSTAQYIILKAHCPVVTVK